LQLEGLHNPLYLNQAVVYSHNKRTIHLNRNTVLITILGLCSLIAGYLLSGISFIGRVGIGLFYREYLFLKVWWKGAILVFVVWLLLFFIHSSLQKKLNTSQYKKVAIVSTVIALAGLVFSYADFRNSISHRWLGERFHLGVYMFWLVWVMIVVFLHFKKRDQYQESELINESH
jgi:hypothetical protein